MAVLEHIYNRDAMVKGSYMLVLRINRQARFQVGRLGAFTFPSGWYLYIGSALRGLDSRLRRHARREKRLHWHIDYLTRWASMEEAWVVESEEPLECVLAHIAQSLPGSAIVAAGFGASDCRCATHLFHFRRRPSLAAFVKALTKEGITVPLRRWLPPVEPSPG